MSQEDTYGLKCHKCTRDLEEDWDDVSYFDKARVCGGCFKKFCVDCYDYHRDRCCGRYD